MREFTVQELATFPLPKNLFEATQTNSSDNKSTS